MNDYRGGSIERSDRAFTPKVAFCLLVFLVWIRWTVLNYVFALFSRLPVVGVVSNWIFPLMIVALIFFSFPYIRQRVQGTEIVLYLAVVPVLLSSMLLYPSTGNYISASASDLFLTILPMIFLGTCYQHETAEKTLFWASLASIGVSFLYQIRFTLSGRTIYYDEMDRAYKLLPSVLYLLYWAFTHKKLWHWLIGIAAAAMLFIFGTRGPILNLIVFLAVAFLYMTAGQKMKYGTLIRILVVAAVIYVLTSDILEQTAEFLSDLFDQWGFSTRFFDLYLEGELTDGTGREYLAERGWAAIKEGFLFGYGVMGDRVVLRGSYVHNIILEMWLHYGVVAGTLIMLAIVWLAYKAIRNQRGDSKNVLFILLLLCMNISKLMVSGSYLREANFFFMIGVLIAAGREEKNPKTIEGDYEAASR